MSSFSRMSSSLRLAQLSRLPRSPVRVRFAHFDHANPRHLPFGFANRRAFAIKYTAFVSVGFSIPFIASYWQLRKSGGAPA